MNRKHEPETAGPSTARPEIFLLLPGLNLDPQKLQPLADFLGGRGHEVLQPFPNGYFSVGDSPAAGITAEGWLEAAEEARLEAARSHPGAALSLAAYSMGAPLGLALSRAGSFQWRRVVLISPAFSPRWYWSALIAAMSALLPGGFCLPSGSPPAYRLCDCTPLAAYRAVGRLSRRFRRGLVGEGGSLPAPPQFMAYSPRDELISTGFIRRYQGIGPGGITVHELTHTPRPGFPHHLGIDEFTLGEEGWRGLRSALSRWLDETESNLPVGE